MLTFDDARKAAVKAVEGDWPKGNGTLYADLKGYTDGKVFAVNLGPEEWLVDWDVDFMPLDPPLALVDIRSGKVTVITYLDDPDRIDKMRLVKSSFA